MSDLHLETALSQPSGFRFGEVSSLHVVTSGDRYGQRRWRQRAVRPEDEVEAAAPERAGEGSEWAQAGCGRSSSISTPSRPHVSVATLVPGSPIPVPSSARA